MMALRSRGRLATAVGLAVAAVAATVLAIAGNVAHAVPSGPAKCKDNVNVRERPEATARVIAVCPKDKAVTVEASRNGFAKLKEYSVNGREGWASETFITGGPARSGSATTSGTAARSATSSTTGSGRSAATSSSSAARESSAPSSEVTVEDSDDEQAQAAPERPRRGGLFG